MSERDTSFKRKDHVSSTKNEIKQTEKKQYIKRR